MLPGTLSLPLSLSDFENPSFLPGVGGPFPDPFHQLWEVPWLVSVAVSEGTLAKLKSRRLKDA